jgi:hypothetical protein
MRRGIPIMLAATIALSGVAAASADASSSSLRGSRAAMLEQNQVARAHGLAFHSTPNDIRAAVERGDLVPLTGNADYEVADFVRFPYAHPAAHLFVERLSVQYREACGQKLVVTSAVRPASGQPRNAHALSVHPAGMALDLRVSDRSSCREWLESALLNLERQGVLNGIREFRPPHYHVAIFPEQYMAWAVERMAAEAAEAAAIVVETAEAVTPVTPATAAPEPVPAPRRRLPVAATALLILALPLGTRALKRRRA